MHVPMSLWARTSESDGWLWFKSVVKLWICEVGWSAWVSWMDGHMVDDAAMVLARSPNRVIHWILDSVSTALCCVMCACFPLVLSPSSSRWDLHLAATKLLEWRTLYRYAMHKKQRLATEDGSAFEPKRRPRKLVLEPKVRRFTKRRTSGLHQSRRPEWSERIQPWTKGDEQFCRSDGKGGKLVQDQILLNPSVSVRKASINEWRKIILWGKREQFWKPQGPRR